MLRTSPRKKSQPTVPSTIPTTVPTNRRPASTKQATTDTETSIKPTLKRKSRVEKNTTADESSLTAQDPCDSCGEKEEAELKPAKKRRTVKSKGTDDAAMPLTTRTLVSSLKRTMYIGAHVSGAGGVHNSIANAQNIGANAFAVFLKSQRKWESPPLASDVKKQFIALAKQHSYDPMAHIVPHGSYLVNLAQADRDKSLQAYTSFLDDLRRCEHLGIRLYNFHPGNTGGASREDACARIAVQLNRAHSETKTVVTLLENTAGAGNVIGTKFEDLRDIIAAVEDKSRVGVCLDTCHTFAAGYDLRTPETFAATLAEFDRIVGLSYLRAIHVNDSKAPFDSHRDVHANIGTGFIGLRAFHFLVNHESFQNLPMILETPMPDGKNVDAEEIKLLESLVGMDTDSKEFKDREIELQDKGATERKKFQDQADKKTAKETKKAGKPISAPARKVAAIGRSRVKPEKEV